MLYAAYGSCLHPLALLDRIDSTRFLGTAELIGWTLRFDGSGGDGSGKCRLEHSAAAAQLAIYSVSDRELDALESIQSPGFVPTLLPVEPYGSCLAFVAPEHSSERAPFGWYREMVELGARYHRLPNRTLTRIAAQPTIEDPDDNRRARALSMLQRMREFPASAVITSQP